MNGNEISQKMILTLLPHRITFCMYVPYKYLETVFMFCFKRGPDNKQLTVAILSFKMWFFFINV